MAKMKTLNDLQARFIRLTVHIYKTLAIHQCLASVEQINHSATGFSSVQDPVITAASYSFLGFFVLSVLLRNYSCQKNSP